LKRSSIRFRNRVLFPFFVFFVFCSLVEGGKVNDFGPIPGKNGPGCL
jgi:hypothetical protein